MANHFLKWSAAMANHILAPMIMSLRFLASLHEPCGFPHTAAYLVSLDGHRHKQFMATELNQMANKIMKWLAAWPVLKKLWRCALIMAISSSEATLDSAGIIWREGIYCWHHDYSTAQYFGRACAEFTQVKISVYIIQFGNKMPMIFFVWVTGHGRLKFARSCEKGELQKKKVHKISSFWL